MATLVEQQRLRVALGLQPNDITSLPDDVIDAIFDEAGETYTDATSIHAATRVIALDRLLIQAASDVDYTQNNTSEKASQRYAMLSKERERWQAKLDEAVAAGRSSAARFGRTTRKPARIKEYPNTWETWGW